MAEMSNSPTAAFCAMLRTADAIGRQDLPPGGLTIAMHGEYSPVGRSLLSAMRVPESKQTCVSSGHPDVIIEGVRKLVIARVTFGKVVIAFEAHHMTHAQLHELLLWTREALERVGVLLFADYAFGGLSEDDILQRATSDHEAKQIEQYGGYSDWIDAHRSYTGASMRNAVEMAGFPAQGIDLPGGRHMIVSAEESALPQY
jgi:hypothetical protein